MKYFDIAGYKVDPSLAKRLGYAKIFPNDEISLETKPINRKTQYILYSSDPSQVHRALKDPLCLGLALHDNTLVKKSIEQLNDNEKCLFLITSKLIGSESGSSLRSFGRARQLLASARRSGAKVALVTMANDAADLLSPLQMLGIAKLLGADDEYAKKMLNAWCDE